MAMQTKEAWNLHRNSKSYTGAYPEGYLRNVDRFIGLTGKKVFDYDIFECPEELKGQLKIGDFFG